MADPIPTIIDCDTGIDDSLALLYACASPEADLLAVTCVSGNVPARQVAENSRAVLELAGRRDVEVALGREVPLVRDLMIAPETHGPRGIGYAELPRARAPLSPRHASDLIIEEARRRPGDVLLITIGPLTNLAVALLREPELPGLLRGLVMMAGSYRSPGNTAPTTEWNVAVDPEAMQVVLRAFGRPGAAWLPRAFGLDVTERAKFVPEHMAQLAARAGCRPDGSALEPDGVAAPKAAPASRGANGRGPSGRGRSGRGANPVIRYVADALRFYMEFHSRSDGFYGAYIHDALAVAAALDPSLARVEALPVEVELGGLHTAGETVTDWRRRWGRPPNLDVVVEADISAFFARFIERVGGLAATRAHVSR